MAFAPPSSLQVRCPRIHEYAALLVNDGFVPSSAASPPPSDEEHERGEISRDAKGYFLLIFILLPPCPSDSFLPPLLPAPSSCGRPESHQADACDAAAPPDAAVVSLSDALRRACATQDEVAIRTALLCGADPNLGLGTRGGEGVPPLHIAASRCGGDAVRELLDAGAKANF